MTDESLIKISSIIKSYKYNYSNEDILQKGIAKVLDLHGISYSREHKLSDRDRIDFYTNSIGIEVKTKGSATNLARQIRRYLDFEDVKAIIVVCTKKSLTKLPEELNSKPIHVCYLSNL